MASTPIRLPDRSVPGAVPPRHDWRAFGWRLFVAVLFVAALARLIQTHPVPHDAGPQRLALDSITGGALPDPSGPPTALPRPLALVALTPDLARASNAAVAVQGAGDAAPPFRAAMAPDSHGRAADCLAAALWYEAGDDPPGERAVAQVVLNRVRHPAFPKSVCGVVFQDAGHASACQFTFACDGSMVARQPGLAAWSRARAIAMAALAGAVDPAVGLATHYHADYVVPQWRDSLVKLGAVGPHLFYRWPGFWGTAGALHALPAGTAEPRVPQLARLSPAHGLPTAFASLPEDDTVTHHAGPDFGRGQALVAAPSAVQTSASAPARVPDAALRLTMTLDPAAFPGSYAVRAFGLCKDHPHCLVLGRTGDPALTFVYMQDTRKGVQTALWNCARTPRPDHAQCLPDAAGVARLIAGW